MKKFNIDIKKLSNKLKSLKESLSKLPKNFKIGTIHVDFSIKTFYDDFADITYNDIVVRNMYPELSELNDAMDSFIRREEYEKCAVIKKLIDTRYK